MIYLAVTLVIISAFVLWMQRKTYILQYLFFLRYPLLTATMLIAIGFLAGDEPESTFGNIFIQKNLSLLITSSIAVFTAWTAMYTFLYMWIRIPVRTGLAFSRDISYNSLFSSFSSPKGRRSISMLVAFPLIGQCVYRSATMDSVWGPVIYSLAGVCIAWIFVGIFLGTSSWIGKNKGKEAGKGQGKFNIWRIFGMIPIWIDRIIVGDSAALSGNKKQTGFEKSIPGLNDYGFNTGNAIVFGIGSFAVYIMGYFLLHPVDGSPYLRENVPILVYVLTLLMWLCWLLSWASFQFDRYRMIPEVLIIVFAGIFWGVSGADHFYVVKKPENSPQGYVRDLGPEDYLNVKVGEDKPAPVIVVVAASGGGIRAAVWTATVLTGLTDQVPGFAESIHLVSSSSGGGVGAMYFVDDYKEGVPPVNLTTIRDAAARPSLSAMGWGLVYPDFWRFFVPFLIKDELDRGWAIETRWSEAFEQGSSPTLYGWKGGVKNGWRPGVVFNTTLSESGQQLMISNLDFYLDGEGGLPGIPRVRSFRGLYPETDLAISTAARLSATFPWVTPVARPLMDTNDGNMYHVADGGYYDNFGVLSSIEYLREVLPSFKEREGEKVLIVQIRGSNTEKIKKGDTDKGFQFETIGPITTMIAVRTTSQIARNDLIIELLKSEWKEKGIDIEEVTFELKPPAPLSWQLTSIERQNIERYFECKQIQEKAGLVASFVGINLNVPGVGRLKEVGCS